MGAITKMEWQNEYIYSSSHCDKCGELTDNKHIREVDNGVFWCSICRSEYLEMME